MVAGQRPRPLPLFLDLVREAAGTNPVLAARALEGLRLYQSAERRDQERLQNVLAQAGRVRLVDYGGNGPPVIFVPSLINPHIILDLAEGNSLIGYIAAAGFRPLLVDWGKPTIADASENLADHITHYIVPLIHEIEETTGQMPHLVGYCLGGTMALAAAHLAPVASLSLIASPWHFDRYGDDRSMLSGLWTDNQEACTQLGFVPMEVLQAAFWRMDPSRTVQKFADLAARNENQIAQFVQLEDWANDGAPLTYAAGEDLFTNLFRENITGAGKWTVGGKIITPATLPCHARQFVSTTDRIVPLDSCAEGIPNIPSPAGHVGMVVGSSARATLWDPLAKWLSQVQHDSKSPSNLSPSQGTPP